MKTFLFVVLGFGLAFYLFFYISGLVFINKTKKEAEEQGWTLKDFEEFERLKRTQEELEKESRIQEYRENMIWDTRAEDPISQMYSKEPLDDDYYD